MKEGYKKTELGEIPVEWEIKKISEIANVISGGTPSTQIKDYWDNGTIAWATPTDITATGKYIKKTEQYITEEGLKNSSANMLPIGSVLMTSRATIGAKSISTVPMTTNQGFKSLICSEKSYNEYIYYLIDIIRDGFIKLSSGSTFLEISKKEVENFKIAIPPIQEQKKIASILSTVDNQIENTEKLIDKTKELKQGLMQTLLTKGIGHTEFKKTEVGEIPVEWEVKTLEEICFNITIGLVKTMTKNYVESGVPLIRNSDIKENKIRKDSLIYLSEDFAIENQDKRLKVGDIVTVHTGDIGTSAVIDDELDGAHGFATLNTRVNKEIIDEYYLCIFLNSNIFKKQAYSFSTGDGRNNLNLKDFIKTKIAFSRDILEQKRIASMLSSVDEQIDNYESKKEKLEELKKGLMQQLLTGKIRVKI